MKGFSLIEVLVTVAIASVVLTGTFKVLNISTQSAAVTKTTLTESELSSALNRILGEGAECRENLKPARLTGTNKNKALGDVLKLVKYNDPASAADDIVLVKTDSLFNDRLNIVKMELRGNVSTDPKTNMVKRVFVAYYTKPGLGELETLGGKTCKKSSQAKDLEGCYFTQCTLNFRLDSSGTRVMDCEALNCLRLSGAGGGSGALSCYTVDFEDENKSPLSASDALKKGRSLVGCGGTSDIEKSTTTAFGFAAGPHTTGSKNTLLGYKAGHHLQGGTGNTFVGYRAGFYQKSGKGNIYIGDNVGPPAAGQTAGLNSSGDNQLNIGNLILGRLPASSVSMPSGGGISDDQGVVIHGSLKVVSVSDNFTADPKTDPFTVLEVCDLNGTCKKVCLENGVGCPPPPSVTP